MIAQNYLIIRKGFVLLFEKINMASMVLNQKYYHLLQKNQFKGKDSVYPLHVNNLKNVHFSAANNKISTQKNRLTGVSKIDCLIETIRG